MVAGWLIPLNKGATQGGSQLPPCKGAASDEATAGCSATTLLKQQNETAVANIPIRTRDLTGHQDRDKMS